MAVTADQDNPTAPSEGQDDHSDKEEQTPLHPPYRHHQKHKKVIVHEESSYGYDVKDPEAYQSRKLKKMRHAERLALSLAALSVLLSALCACGLVWTWFWRHGAFPGTTTTTTVYESGNRLCLPCYLVRKSGVFLEPQPSSSSSDESLCCFSQGDKSEAVPEALQMIHLEQRKGVRDNSLHVYYSSSMSQSRVVPRYTPERGHREILKAWAVEGGPAYVGAGIQYSPQSGRFTLNVTGNYIIYSHMSFQPAAHILAQAEQRGHNLTFLFSHVVARASSARADDDVTLLEDGEDVTCYWNKYGGQLHPCHVSNLVAMLPLKAGDELSVAVTPDQFLLGQMSSSYFGICLME